MVWNVCGFGLMGSSLFWVLIGRCTISIDSTVGTERFRGFWMIETQEEVRWFFHSLILSSPPPILDLLLLDFRVRLEFDVLLMSLNLYIDDLPYSVSCFWITQNALTKHNYIRTVIKWEFLLAIVDTDSCSI